MPTNKPKIILVLENELIDRIDDFRFGNRVSSRSKAVRQLIELGLKAAKKSPAKK